MITHRVTERPALRIRWVTQAGAQIGWSLGDRVFTVLLLIVMRHGLVRALAVAHSDQAVIQRHDRREGKGFTLASRWEDH